MAGRARTKALTLDLEKRTREMFEGWDSDSEPSHLDYVCQRVEDGTTTKALAAELSVTLGFELTYAQMMNYLRKAFGSDYEQKVDEARARASHTFVDDALAITDTANPLTVGIATLRARQRNWMAERYNPQRFGQQKGVSVNVSIGSLHLDALRSRQAKVTVGSQPMLNGSSEQAVITPQVVDAEVLSIE